MIRIDSWFCNRTDLSKKPHPIHVMEFATSKEWSRKNSVAIVVKPWISWLTNIVFILLLAGFSTLGFGQRKVIAAIFELPTDAKKYARSGFVLIFWRWLQKVFRTIFFHAKSSGKDRMNSLVRLAGFIIVRSSAGAQFMACEAKGIFLLQGTPCKIDNNSSLSTRFVAKSPNH